MTKDGRTAARSSQLSCGVGEEGSNWLEQINLC